MTSRGVVSMTLLSLATLASALALACTPAQAHVLHKYESQITEVPASSGASAPGKLNEPQAMTVYAGHLYMEEQFGPSNGGLRADEFGPAGTKPVKYEFLSQLVPTGLGEGTRGIAFGTSTGETEMYMATARPGGIAVFGAGICGTLECANFQEEWTGADTPTKSFTEMRSIAVDNSTNPSDWARGDILVREGEEIDVFKPEIDGKEKYITSFTGTTLGLSTQLHSSQQIAVSGFNGELVVAVPAVGGEIADVFAPKEIAGEDSYSLVGELKVPSGPLTNPNTSLEAITVDSNNGHIFVLTTASAYEFDSNGTFLGAFNGETTPEHEWSFQTYHPLSIAVDPVSHRAFVGLKNNSSGVAIGFLDSFSPDLVVPDVTTGSTSGTGIVPATHTWDVTLHGTVNPDGEGNATCTFAWGESKAFGGDSQCASAIANGGSPVPVQTTLTGLASDTTYFFRLRAENTNGQNPGEEWQDAQFTTPGPAVGNESVSEVSSSSARLQATINPNSDATSYHFEYDTTPYSPDEGPHGTSFPLAGVQIGSADNDVEFSQNAQDLVADTSYDYRVVAVSEIEPGVLEEFPGPNQTFTTQLPGEPLSLLDGRMWELVSPVDKHGALIESIGEAGLEQASSNGAAFTYRATVPTEAAPPGYGEGAEQVLSSRIAGHWSSIDLGLSHLAPTGVPVGHGHEYRFFSEDLSTAVVEPFGPFSRPEGEHENAQHEEQHMYEDFPEATERTAYARHDTTCKTEPATCYTPLLTGAQEYADVTSNEKFGGNPEGNFGEAEFVGASPDASHLVLNSKVKLTSGSGSGLYEWSASASPTERLRPVSVLPAGNEVPATLGYISFPFSESQRNAVSEDGNRIFFTVGGLYMRDIQRSETVRLDAGASRAGHGPAFQLASIDGSAAFFTDDEGLTADSGTSGADLYECRIIEVEVGGKKKLSCELSDLTPPPTHGAPGSEENADTQGSVLGASNDGGYVYFVARGVQAEGATPGADNLYVNSGGVTSLVATLSLDDAPDWGAGGSLGETTSRVSPNGVWLSFMSDRSLTGYDNRDAKSGMPDEEVYLYDAETHKLVCASCNPTGARPVGLEEPLSSMTAGFHVWTGHWVAANVPGWTPYTLDASLYQSRYLSDQGRLFFNTDDALATQDINGNEDVYEYEPLGVGGSNGCNETSVTLVTRTGGCLGLISSGVAFGESAFLDASAAGGDVFFLTTEKLVSEDLDTALDVYDAHECSPESGCSSPSTSVPAPCGSAGACRVAPSPQPSIYGAPSSATFTGAGNVSQTPPPPIVGKKGLTRAQRLARALKACKKLRSRGRRAGCERQARKRYGSVQSSKARAKRRVGR